MGGISTSKGNVVLWFFMFDREGQYPNIVVVFVVVAVFVIVIVAILGIESAAARPSAGADGSGCGGCFLQESPPRWTVTVCVGLLLLLLRLATSHVKVPRRGVFQWMHLVGSG